MLAVLCTVQKSDLCLLRTRSRFQGLHQTAQGNGLLLYLFRADEERQRQLELERRAREAEEERQLQEARAAREAKRRALDKLARRFAVKLEGSASIDKPPQVLQTSPGCRRLTQQGRSSAGTWPLACFRT
jgi:hypothetical protein